MVVNTPNEECVVALSHNKLTW